MSSLSFALNIDPNNMPNIADILIKKKREFSSCPNTIPSIQLMIELLVFGFTSYENIGIDKSTNIEQQIPILCMRYLAGNTLNYPFMNFPRWCSEMIFGSLFMPSTTEQRSLICDIIDTVIIATFFRRQHIVSLYLSFLLPISTVVSIYDLLHETHVINESKLGLFLASPGGRIDKLRKLRYKCETFEESLNVETKIIEKQYVAFVILKPTLSVQNTIQQLITRKDMFENNYALGGLVHPKDFDYNHQFIQLILESHDLYIAVLLIYELIKQDHRYIQIYHKYVNIKLISEMIPNILYLIRQKGQSLDIRTMQMMIHKLNLSPSDIDYDYIFNLLNVNPWEWFEMLHRLEMDNCLNNTQHILNVVKIRLRKNNVYSYMDIEWNLLDESYCYESMQFIFAHCGLLQKKLLFYIKTLKKTNLNIKRKEMTQNNLENAIKVIWKINNKIKIDEKGLGYQVEKFKKLYVKITKTKLIKPILNKFKNTQSNIN